MMFALVACKGENRKSSIETPSQSVENSEEKAPTTHDEISVNISPDKYTWYIKDYVGKNLASLGYTSVSEARLDQYGAGYIKLSLINQSGKYIDIENEDELKKYVVVAQNLEPNTEVKYTFEKDEEGNEYDNLVLTQTVEEVLLFVKEVGDSDDADISLTRINASPDVYTHYVRDYVGRNLNSCGYLSLAGDLRDRYGISTIKFVLVTNDGNYIDTEDEEMLKKYSVISQNVAPNTEIKYELAKDSDGNEYSNLVHSQNIEEIELHVALIEE